MQKIFYFLLFTFCFSCLMRAESISTGQQPPGLNWKTIHTDHYEIIFPEKITADAQRIANTLEFQYTYINKTLKYNAKKISLILTTESVIPNGYFTMAPRRMEWFSSPFAVGADDGDWYNLLASHEIRHVDQFDKILHRGFNLILGFVFGQDVPYVMTDLIVPSWFWEGDAVLAETALSHDGRGRDPSFDIGIRSLILNHQRYSYYKAVLGSYKDYFPNEYPLGYLMVTHVRRNYDPYSWGNILGRTSFFIWFPFGFSASTRGIIKKNVVHVYNDAMGELSELWEQQQKDLILTEAIQLNHPNNVYTNYYFPQELKDGSIITLKTGLSDPQRLVMLHDGIEKKLMDTAVLNTFSASGNKLTWDEYRPDLRWSKRSYSNIVVYDFDKHRKKTITSKGKYSTPALSPDGKMIAAIEFTPERNSTLVILDSENGKVIDRAPNPYNEVLRQPAWSEDGQQIVYTNQYADGKALSIYDLKGKKIREIMPHSWQGIMNPVFYGRYILFNSFYSGIDNIYAVDWQSGQPYRVTSRPYGAYNPSVSPDGRKLYFNDYTIKGHQAAVMDLDTTQWIRIEEVKDRTIRYYEPVIGQEYGGNLYNLDSIPKRKYDVSNYNAFRHLFNFHSWQVVTDTLNPGVYFKSANIMNTLELGLGGFFNRNERQFGGLVNLTYSGFYPVIDGIFDRRGRVTVYTNSKGETVFEDNWIETSAAIGLRLPLNLSRGVWQREVLLAAYLQATKIEGQVFHQNYDLSNGYFNPVSYQFSFGQIKPYVRRDMRPRFGQLFDVIYRYTPLKGNYDGSQFAADATLFFPGFFKHHALWFEGDYEEQQPVNYHFQAQWLFPRGYRYRYFDKIVKGSVNYAFPIAYPDLSLGPFFYLKRIKTNLFYDYGIGNPDTDNQIFRSAGFELLFDHHWFTFFIEFEMGWRMSYKIETGKPFSEFLFQLPLY
jgi:hypothetical protein